MTFFTLFSCWSIGLFGTFILWNSLCFSLICKRREIFFIIYYRFLILLFQTWFLICSFVIEYKLFWIFFSCSTSFLIFVFFELISFLILLLRFLFLSLFLLMMITTTIILILCILNCHHHSLLLKHYQVHSILSFFSVSIYVILSSKWEMIIFLCRLLIEKVIERIREDIFSSFLFINNRCLCVLKEW